MKSNLFSGHNKLLRAIPLVIIAVALVMTIFGAGMNLGIDFTGGSLFTYKVGEDFDVSVVESALATAGIKEAQIAKTGTSAEETQLEVRAKDLGSEAENMRAVFEDELKKTYPNLTYYTTDTVGAVAGRDLINNAVKACLIVFVCLLIYIAIRFDFTSGLAALLALAHDILIMCAFMTFARGAYQVNTSFIAALLTIIGYSINNTIIIFDRIRENKKLLAYKTGTYADLVGASVAQTFSRTVNTTITTLVTLVVLYIMGVSSIKEFVFPLIVGMLAGVYSSVFLSGQFWASWMDKGTFDGLNNLFKGNKAKKSAKKA